MEGWFAAEVLSGDHTGADEVNHDVGDGLEQQIDQLCTIGIQSTREDNNRSDDSEHPVGIPGEDGDSDGARAFCYITSISTFDIYLKVCIWGKSLLFSVYI